MAKKVGGHGGMDFIMDWRLIDCLRNGLPLDQNVYDGALWSSIAPLSEWSVANRSQSIDVPDFTCGSWKTNVPHGINLETGGSTKVLEIVEAKEELQLNSEVKSRVNYNAPCSLLDLITCSLSVFTGL